MKNGIPFDVSFALDDVMRAAWCIKFSQFEGNHFNVDTMSWGEK